jgi:hypothetical protein
MHARFVVRAEHRLVRCAVGAARRLLLHRPLSRILLQHLHQCSLRLRMVTHIPSSSHSLARRAEACSNSFVLMWRSGVVARSCVCRPTPLAPAPPQARAPARGLRPKARRSARVSLFSFLRTQERPSSDAVVLLLAHASLFVVHHLWCVLGSHQLPVVWCHARVSVHHRLVQL